MADPLWYYSQDGRECGPAAMARLAELAAAGTIKPTDLVWREGMPDWTPASQVKGLYAPAPPTRSGMPPAAPNREGMTPPRIRAAVAGAMGGLLGEGSRVPRNLLLAGIVLVVVARGCDGLGERNVARLGAKEAVARQQFGDECELSRLRLQQAIEKLTPAKGEPSADDKKELDRLHKELAELPRQQAEAREKLTDGEWREREIASRDAKWDNAIWAYWRQLLFVFGSLCLIIGLVLVGSGSQGAERWVMLAMLAIIIYSIFIGGAAWGTGAHGPLP